MQGPVRKITRFLRLSHRRRMMPLRISSGKHLASIGSELGKVALLREAHSIYRLDALLGRRSSLREITVLLFRLYVCFKDGGKTCFLFVR